MRRSSRRWVITMCVLLIAAMAVAMTLRSPRLRDALMRADPQTILDQPKLARAAIAIGRDGFAAHCASCHGEGGADPARGVPDLTDQEYLYGSGRVEEIEQIVLHGIR